MATQADADDIISRIMLRPNIAGVIVVNSDHVPIKSNIANSAEQTQYAHLVSALAAKARHCIRDLDPGNDLTFIRLRSKKTEIMVAPDKEFTLIVIQKIEKEKKESDE
jgi:dynein light chain roadblock-type